MTLQADQAACIDERSGHYFPLVFPDGGPWSRLVVTIPDRGAQAGFYFKSDQFPIPPVPIYNCITTAPFRAIRETTTEVNGNAGVYVPYGDRVVFVFNPAEGDPAYVYLRWEK